MDLRAITGLACMLCLALTPAFAGGEAHDYPSLGHVSGYKIYGYEERRFDRVAFRLPDREMSIEGHTIHIQYTADGSEPMASYIEIARSYKLVMDSLGAEILSYNDSNGSIVGHFTRNNVNVFAGVSALNGGGQYELWIVEEKSFRPLIEPPSNNH